MSDLLDTLQQRHQECLEQLNRRKDDDALLKNAQALISDLREAGGASADPVERGQLRALLRFWGSVVYDHTGGYPSTTLVPLEVAGARPTEQPSRRSLPPLIWMLLGGAAVAIIALGVVAIGQLSQPRALPEEVPSPVALPRVVYSAVGTNLDEDGVLQEEIDTFCLGTSSIFSNFALEDLEPAMELRWELRREGELTSSQLAEPWGEDPPYVTIRIRSADEAGVRPGRYGLVLYANDQAVGFESFEVLGSAPRIYDLQVSDVPLPAVAAPDEPEFEPGLRVVYLTYRYAGLCPGLELLQALHGGNGSIHEVRETWRGAHQGQAQVSFQTQDGLQFLPGDYVAATSLAGEEQGRSAFAIKEDDVMVIEEAEEEPVEPAFGDVTFTLGVYPDGEPILAALDGQFESNTKVVYGVFGYAGMRDGMTWTTVWRRNGLEVGRQEYSWDEATLGTAGTHWAAYHDDYGRPLAGGNYSVTLYIDDVEQRTAGFSILYYAQ